MNEPERQEVRANKYQYIRTPWWRLPPMGYVLTFPLVGLGLLIPFSLGQLKIYDAFLDTPLVLVTLIIALIWGTGPAMLSILLGTMTFDIYFLSPMHQLFQGWNESIPLVPFILAEIIIVILTSQRERAQKSTLFAQEELKNYAGQLEWVNRQLEEANHELGQTIQELEKANKLKDQFLLMAPHESKVPLATIRGRAQLKMLRRKEYTDLHLKFAPLHSSSEVVSQQIPPAGSSVDNLLDLSLLRSDKIPLYSKRCDIGKICQQIITQQRSRSGRIIELAVPFLPVMLEANCERMGQVITNLVDNALMYSSDNSTVQVHISQISDKVMIQVHNEGSIISQEQQARIFEPFHQVSHSQTLSKKGWGLSLAISKEVIEHHRGRIWVESSEEKGTTFNIELPISQTP